VGGVLVKTCFIALREARKTNSLRYQIQFCIWAN